MDSRVQTFLDSLNKKKIAFIGIGVSHNELIKLFLSKGAYITLCDRRVKEQIENAAELESMGVKLKLGDNYLDKIDAEMIIRTPGMYFNNEALTQYRKNGIAVTSEMELFFDLCPCKIIAVTGSDGKTTTTTIISKMLEAQGKTVHLGGNIGRALMPIIETISEDDYAVVELSSFQLISMRRSPDVAVITNIAPNHLDVHGNMEEYIDAKKNDPKIPENENALFLSMQYKRINVRSVEFLVKKYSKTVTPLKKITPHKLRSTYGTRLYNETGDIYVVADVLGHKDVNTTKRHYAAITQENRRRVAGAVKLHIDSSLADSSANNSEETRNK